MLVFTGRYDYSIDEKGRLSIPARMRERIEKDHQPLILFITLGPKGQLLAYAEKEYHELMAAVGPREDEGAAEAMRMLTENTEECPIDGQGRVALPARLRELAGIGRDVAVLGVNKRIEIWDRERIRKYREDNAARIQSAMGALKARADLWG